LHSATGKLNHLDVCMKRIALLCAVVAVMLGAMSSSAFASSSSCSTYNPQNCSNKTTSTPTATSPATTTTPTTTKPITTTSTLPFTGADVGLLVLGGALLCAGGLGVRRLSRRFD
jgi:hypothetical protein